ncbi:MAG: M42 family metallopeptidase [Candidatus Hodarchaeales archaeon]
MKEFKEEEIDLLATLTELPGPVGREEIVQDFLKSYLDRLDFKTRYDGIGNLTATLEGTGEELILTAHADEIGYIVSNIRDDGIISIHYNTGAPNPDTRFLPGKDVTILGKGSNVEGIIGFLSGHLASFEDKKKIRKIYDMFVDTGLTKTELEEEGVTIGTPVLLESEFKLLGNHIKTKAIDDRVGLFLMLEVAKELSKTAIEERKSVTLISTVQEEIGIKGAVAAARNVSAPVLVLDVGPAGGYPVGDKKTNVRLDHGPIIVYKDFMIHYSYSFIQEIESVANDNCIPFQRAIYKNYGTDGAAFITEGVMKTALVAIPTKYTHSPVEMASLSDIRMTLDLLMSLTTTSADKG